MTSRVTTATSSQSVTCSGTRSKSTHATNLNSTTRGSRRRRKLPTSKEDVDKNSQGCDYSGFGVDADKENSYSEFHQYTETSSRGSRSRGGSTAAKEKALTSISDNSNDDRTKVSISKKKKDTGSNSNDDDDELGSERRWTKTKSIPSSIPPKKPQSRSRPRKSTQKSHPNIESFTQTLQDDNQTITNAISSKTLLITISNASAKYPMGASDGKGMILLEEKLMDVIHIARRCILSASSPNSAPDKKSIKGDQTVEKEFEHPVAFLRTAIRCLRSVVPLLLSSPWSASSSKSGNENSSISSNTKTMVIKLLYHCITAAESIQKKIHKGMDQEEKNTNTENGSSSNLGESSFLDASNVCLYAYQMLGSLLADCLCGFVTHPLEEPADMYNSVHFPIPLIGELNEVGFSARLKEMGMSIQQIVKLSTQSILAISGVVNCLIKAYAVQSIQDEHAESDQGRDLDRLLHSLLKLDGKEKDDLKSDESLETFVSFVDGLRYIITQFAAPWSVLSLTLSECDADQEQSSIVFISKASKVMLDTATFSEKLCSRIERNEATHCLQSQSLSLQQDSIIILLGYLRNNSGNWVSMDELHNYRGRGDFISSSKGFAKACASAIRAAVSFNGRRESSVLKNFHDTVGCLLDKSAEKHVVLEDDYIEYSVHRAMHLTNDTGLSWELIGLTGQSEVNILATFPFPFANKIHDHVENIPKITILGVAFFSIVSKCFYPASSTEDSFLAFTDDIVERFRNSILPKDRASNSNTLTLAQRILSKLKLQTFAMEQMKNIDDKLTPEQYRLTFVTARILAECLAPLNFTLMKSSKGDKSKNLSLALDCYLRGANLMDGLSYQAHLYTEGQTCTISNQDTCLEYSDKYIELCRKISVRCLSKNLIPFIGSLAKAISNIAKRRISKKLPELSLCPFFASLDMFTITKDPLLASRMLQLSAVLQSLNMTKEAMGVLSSSIYHKAKDYDAKAQAGFMDIENAVLLCEDYFEGTIPSEAFMPNNALGKELKQSLQKLAHLLLGAIGNHDNQSKTEKRKGTSCSLFEAQIHSLPNYGDNELMRFIIRTSLGSDGRHDAKYSLKLKIAMAFQFLEYLAGATGTRIRSATSSTSLSLIFTCFRIVVNEIGDLFDIDDYPLTISFASLSINAEVNIRALRRLNIQEGADTYDSTYFIDLAMDRLSKSIQKELPFSMTVQLMIAKLSVLVLHRGENPPVIVAERVSRKSDFDSLILPVTALIKRISENKTEWTSEGPRKFNNVLLLNLFKIIQKCDLEGLSTLSHKFALLLKEILQLLGFERSCHFDIAAMIALSFTEIADHSYNVEKYVSNECARALFNLGRKTETNYASIFQHVTNELRIKTPVVEVSEVRSDLVTDLYASSSNILSVMLSKSSAELPIFLSDLAQGISSYMDVFSNSSIEYPCILKLSLLWWVSSCYVALHYGHKRIGEYYYALYYARQCCDICKAALASARKLKNCALRSINIDGPRFLLSYTTPNDLKKSFMNRFTRSLELVANLYCSLGNVRKSKRYIMAAAETIEVLPKAVFMSTMPTLRELVSVMSENCHTVRHLQLRTTATSIFSLAIPTSSLAEEVCQILINLAVKSNEFCSPFLPIMGPHMKDSKKDLLREASTFIDLLRDRCEIPKDIQGSLNIDLTHSSIHYGNLLVTESLSMAKEMFSIEKKRIGITETLKFYANTLDDCKRSPFYTNLCKSSLIFVKELELSTTSCHDECTQILEYIAHSSFAPFECRAESLLLLGLDYLEQGKHSRELQYLWAGYSSYSGSKESIKPGTTPPVTPNLDKARHLLLKAASISSSASSLMYRKILRSLALTMGPENSICKNNSISAGELIHSSIGSSARQIMSGNFAAANQHPKSKSIFDAYDCSISDLALRQKYLSKMYQMGRDLLPISWNFVAIASCPTGELLVSNVKVSNDSKGGDGMDYETVCIFPDTSGSLNEESAISETILQPFDDIMERSKTQLSGIDQEIANNLFNLQKERKQTWWKERHSLDEELRVLLEHIDTKYFMLDCIRNLISQDDAVNQDNIEASDCRSDLSARFEEACEVDDIGSLQRGESVPGKVQLSKLTVVKLKERLKEEGVSTKEMRSLRKADLIKMLQTHLSKKNEKKLKSPKLNQSNIAGCCTFLILDENLVRLPLEALNTFQGQTVCRLPSLPFAIESMRQIQYFQSNINSHINPSQTKYVVDPESNLASTRECISELLSTISKKNSWQWDGISGCLPSKEFMQNSLRERNSLFLYFGHGAGERFFSRGDIEHYLGHLEQGKDDKLDSGYVYPCKASLILMGCSSGSLVSVNTEKGIRTLGNQIHYEPEGAALSYLCAGAPCVVGNLWDVTDRDIDRFSTSLLEGIFQNSKSQIKMNLAKCVEYSRNACKLKYLVGAAPVVYGIPISLRNCS